MRGICRKKFEQEGEKREVPFVTDMVRLIYENNNEQIKNGQYNISILTIFVYIGIAIHLPFFVPVQIFRSTESAFRQTRG